MGENAPGRMRRRPFWRAAREGLVGMGKAMRLGGLGTLVVAVVGALALSGGPAMAAPSSTPVAYTCTGGDFQTGTFVPIPSGTYANITVAGACAPAANAVITVLGDVNVAPGAVLNAQSFPSTITLYVCGRNPPRARFRTL